MKHILRYLWILILISTAAYAVPSQPNAPDLDASYDSGDSTTDNLTNNSTLYFTGNKLEGETIRVYRGTTDTGQTSSSFGTTYAIFVYSNPEGSNNFSVTADANDGTGESIKSAPIEVVTDYTSPIMTFTLEDGSNSGLTTDLITNDTTPTFSVSVDEYSAVYIDNIFEGYKQGSWTYSATYAGDQYGITKYLSPYAVDKAGNYGYAASLDLIIDTGAVIAYNTIEPSISTIDYADGIYISFGTDIEYGRTISFVIDSGGANLSFSTTTSDIFIPNSSLGTLVDGGSYLIETDAGLTDIAGNEAVRQNINFNYDKAGDNKNNSLSINISESIVGNIYDATDVDYYIFNVAKKGLLTFNSGGPNIALQTLGADIDVINNTTNSFSEVVDKGSYLLKVDGNTTGNYTLTSSIAEYSEEVDSDVIVKSNPSTVLIAGVTSDRLYVNGGLLYTSESTVYDITNGARNYNIINYSGQPNKMAIKDGIYISVSASNNVNFSDLTKYISNSVTTQGAIAQSVSLVDDTLYVLVDDTLELYDVSDVKSPTFLSTIQLQANIGFNEVIVHKVGTKTYAYIVSTAQDFYVMDITDTANVLITTMLNSIAANDFAIENGVLYIATDSGMYIFDINTEPGEPKLMGKSPDAGRGIAVNNGIVYMSSNYTNISTYSDFKDFDDSVIGEYRLSKIKINTTTTLNKYSGKADVDIFRVDLENSGLLSFSSSNVNASDLNISIDDNSDFLSPVYSGNFKNTSTGNLSLEAKTYYVKISTTDVSNFDDYSVQNIFTKNSTNDAVDALLNIRLANTDSIALNQGLTSSLDNNDTDLYKIELPSDGNLSISITNAKTVALYSADINITSSYAILSPVAALEQIKAGSYYIKVSGADGAYTISPDFISFSTQDEYKQTVVVGDESQPYTVNFETNALTTSGKISHTPYSNVVEENGNQVYAALSAKIYLSQISDGKYIYGLYKGTNPVDANIEIGIDIFEYINSSNKYILDTKVITTTGSNTFEYKLKNEDSKILVREETGWFEYNFDDLASITKSATAYLAFDYIDFEVDANMIYAVDSTKLDILDKTTKLVSNTKYMSDVSSVEYDSNIIYIATTSDGIKALSKENLSLVKDILSIKNVVSLEKISNKLYILQELSRDDNMNRVFKTIELSKDFSGYYANAHQIFFNTDVTGQISVANEVDMFKVELDKTGSLTTTFSDANCTLYSSEFTSQGSCSSGNLLAGNYYFEITHTGVTTYTLNVVKNILNSDDSDSLKFYDGVNTNLSDANATFNSSIDIVNDVDYHKINVDTIGLLTLDSNISTLVNENGSAVDLIGGKYNIDVSGEYFIKVTDSTVAGYTVNASFEPIIENNFIDNTTSENALVSSLKINGDSSKMLSSGEIVYIVDEVDGLSIIDLVDVYNPLVTSRVNLQGTPKKLYLDGSILYVALGIDGFAIIDVSDKNAAKLYSQTTVNDSVNSLTASADIVYLACDLSIKKMNISKATQPQELLSGTSYTNVQDILLDGENLLVADASILLSVKQSDLTTNPISSAIASPQRIVRDSQYIFIQDSSNIIHILNSDLTDTTKTVDDTTSAINDMYINNKILYISTLTGYRIIEYKDINNLSTSFIESAQVNSMTLAQNSLLFTHPKVLNIREAVSDYSDTIISQYINEIDISSDVQTTGEFSKDGDIDTFEYINVEYTGTLDINVNAPEDVNITLLREDGSEIYSDVTNLSVIVNAGDFYIQIKSKVSNKQFSYEFTQSFANDGVLDILDENYNNDEMSINDTKEGNLYAGGKDKDYYKLVVTERGNISFLSDNQNVKISLLYKSGTVIASNYDDENASIENIFDADLAEGEYFVLVENADETYLNSLDYSIETTLSSTGEILMDSGASAEPLDTLSAFSHVDRFSYMLDKGTLHRMSNILESQNEYYMNSFDTNESGVNFSMFSYSDWNEEITYIAKIDQNDNSLSQIELVTYNIMDNEFYSDTNFDMSGITDEKIMLIDREAYIYYYDDDSLYISESTNTGIAQQLALEDLKSVTVSGDYMYLVTLDYIQLVNISDKSDIDISKILSTIAVSNVKSILVDAASNRLFIGVNNKIEVWNISDKEYPSKLSEYDISFSENDLYYTGTPLSLYMLDDKLYAAVEGVGLLFLNINSFNELSIFDKVLNLGEYFTDIYTFNGDAINYVTGKSPDTGSVSSYDIEVDELKVYFYSNQLLDADSAGTYNIVDENSVKEGSQVVEGCFIATAAYGSYFDTNVKVLRDFRDTYLMQNELGRIFVDFYYSNSPSIAKSIANNETAKSIIRVGLTPFVYIIKYPAILAVMMLMLFVVAYRKRTIKFTEKLGRL